MQLLTLVAAAALSATVSATQVNFNETTSDPSARIFNRCPYTVYAWSVVSDEKFDCDVGEPAIIEPGGFYQEKYRKPSFGGISIKLTDSKKCKSGSITQLEYHLETQDQAYLFNSLDVSYVDCGNDDCPTRQEGYYLQSGNIEQDGVSAYATKGDGSICPILSCDSLTSCNACSYVFPNDVQTKTCDNDAPLDFYMCGGQGPDEEGNTVPEAPSSSSSVEEAAPSTQIVEKPTSTTVAAPSSEVVAPSSEVVAPSSEVPAPSSEVAAPSSEAHDEVEAAAITPAPEVPAGGNVMTTVVYETVYVDAKKRHAHARRHQHYHA